MGRIRLLDEGLINKIAAGEVVERPLSVVKELVENAVDAGATTVRVELEDGGRRSIVVSDDGIGMHRDDLAMAVHRHATSKISNVDDLFHITTMGFRGEALSAIGAVSRLTITTREREALDGWRLSLNQEKSTEGSWQGPVGTTVTVADLFYNVPARSKFLKSAQAEYAYCLEFMKAMALCSPQLELILMHNGKEQLHVAPVRSNDHEIWKGEKQLHHRAASLFGEDEVANFIYVRKSTDHGCLEALVSPPGFEKSTAKFMFTFVNERWVRDKVLRQGILRGYHSHLLKGRFPAVIVHLTMDPSLLDVNVHPAKTELRFQYVSEVQELLATEIRRVLRSGAWAQGGRHSEILRSAQNDISAQNDGGALPRHPEALPKDLGILRSAQNDVSAQNDGFARNDGGAPKAAKARDMTITRERISFNPPPVAPKIQPVLGFDETVPLLGGDGAIPWHELRYLGAFVKCYLFFEHGERLLALDQHAFHERVLYERLLQNEATLLQTQRLLMPEVIALSPEQVVQVKEKTEHLRNLGFLVQPISAAEVEVQAVPSLLVNKDFEACLQEVLEAGSNGEKPHLHDVLSTIACHAAVRAGEILCDEDLTALLREASSVDFFHNCPHGRRVFRWFNQSEVARWFDR